MEESISNNSKKRTNAIPQTKFEFKLNPSNNEKVSTNSPIK